MFVRREVTQLDDKLRQMLRDLSRALFQAISDSPEVNRGLQGIREEGYGVYLLLDCKREDQDASSVDAPLRQLPPAEAVFRIDGRDLHFLKSIGIDPTRKSRRRKTSDRRLKSEGS